MFNVGDYICIQGKEGAFYIIEETLNDYTVLDRDTNRIKISKYDVWNWYLINKDIDGSEEIWKPVIPDVNKREFDTVDSYKTAWKMQSSF